MKSLRFGLLPRIVAGLIGAALIPLAVASVQLIRVNTDAMLTQVLRTHSVAAVATAGRLGAQIDALSSAGASVGGAAIGAAEGDRQAPVEVLTAFLAATPQVAGVALVDSEGREILRAQRRGRSDDMAKLLVRPLDRDPHILALGDGRWLALDIELEEGGSWLRMLAEIEDLERTMDPEDLGDEAQLVVMTRDGEAILGGDPESGLKAFPSNLVDAGRSGKMGGAGRYADEAGEVVGAFNPVPGTPWVVLSRQPGGGGGGGGPQNEEKGDNGGGHRGLARDPVEYCGVPFPGPPTAGSARRTTSSRRSEHGALRRQRIGRPEGESGLARTPRERQGGSGQDLPRTFPGD